MKLGLMIFMMMHIFPDSYVADMDTARSVYTEPEMLHEFSVYPQHASNMVWVSLPHSFFYAIQFFDSEADLKKEVNLELSDEAAGVFIDICELEKGQYTLVAKAYNSSSFSARIFKL